MKKNPLAVMFGSLGGKKTREKHGVEYFRAMGKRSGMVRKQKALKKKQQPEPAGDILTDLFGPPAASPRPKDPSDSLPREHTPPAP